MRLSGKQRLMTINECGNHIFIRCWKNKAEWADVFKKAFSPKLCDQIVAYNTMLAWQSRPGNCPLAVVSTCAMLQGVIRDKAFHSDVEEGSSIEDLQLIYGGSIMRFLNMLCCHELKRFIGEDKKVVESLYAKAQKMKIPHWIVDVRHDISHGTSLPEIHILRICVSFILNHLKTYYWEREETCMHDVVQKRPRRETVEECFGKLLNIYVLIKEQQKLGCQNYASIKHQLIKDEIVKIEEYRLVSEQLENAPWEVNYLENKKMVQLTEEKIKSYSLIKLSHVISQYIEEYDNLKYFDPWNCLALYIISNSIKHQDIRLRIWTSMINNFAERGHIKKILEPFFDYIFKKKLDSDKSFWCRKWLAPLLQALLKRAKVEKLKLALIRETKKSKWETKIISSLTPSEVKELRELIAKSESDVKSRVAINHTISRLTILIEKKFPRLKFRLRFFCKPLDDKTILEYISMSCLEPNDFSGAALNYLTSMLENSKSAHKKSLKQLLDIYQNNKSVIGEVSDTIYNLPMLLNKMGVPEDEHHMFVTSCDAEEEVTESKVVKVEKAPAKDSNEVITLDFFRDSRMNEKKHFPSFFPLPWNDEASI